MLNQNLTPSPAPPIRPVDPVAAALGRLFAIGSRPFQPGDHETYEACRSVVMAAAGEVTS